jgi:acyl-coenzyme A synthetase/AMP-(fatty) acid ligase
VTPGYWNNNLKNKESFFEISYNGFLSRFYRTGDSCYCDDTGDFMYLGRLDFQVKVQGYRIELGEIEYTAREFLHGRNAVAVPFENKTGNTEIALFIEGKPDDIKIISERLKQKLPYYMIPTRIINIETFPLNTNSKIDRGILKSLIKL